MRKIILGIGMVMAMYGLGVGVVNASEQIEVSMEVEYEVLISGETKVHYDVLLTNKETRSYASGFELVLDNVRPENVQAYDGVQDFEHKLLEDGDRRKLIVEFNDEPVVGVGEERRFQIDFTERSFVERTGEVWELAIPKMSDTEAVVNYNVMLSVPKAFGNQAYLSPGPLSQTENSEQWLYFFSRDGIADSNITAAFGEFQVFSFELLYHLENPINRENEMVVAIPPDTAFQKVIYQLMEPKPNVVERDGDGNWLAKYVLEARERVDVKVVGSVQIYAEPRDFVMPGQSDLDMSLKPTQWWQSGDERVRDIAMELDGVGEIYDFVVNTLTYDYGRVKPNIRRLGAVEALKNPSSAICMEFTDLFVALARAKNIPAREVNGYVYTENPELQPLSLVADVLHSWPEYWDSERQIWVGVDPTWGSTTGGVDFFNKLDLRHFVFVIHGADAEKPYPPGSYKLGPNPQKDVFVSFGKLPLERSPKVEVEIIGKNRLPFGMMEYEVVVNNTGPVGVYDLVAQVRYDEKVHRDIQLEAIVAHGRHVEKIKVPAGILGTGMPMKIVVELKSETTEVSTQKELVLASVLVVVMILIFGVVVYAMKRYRSSRK